MVYLKGNKVLEGDEMRRRCYGDDKLWAGRTDLAKINNNLLSDWLDVGGER